MEDELDYPTMYNVIYYMMFTENKKQSNWEMVVNATVGNPDILPTLYYRPFKASEFYIKKHFPSMDLVDYRDKFWHPERYFSVFKSELNMLESDPKYYDFKCFLTAKCFVYPIPFMSFHNLFLLHYVFDGYKIAINYHLDNTLIYGKKEPTELQKLSGKLMNYEGWEVLELSELEFNDWTYEERINNIKGWIKEAKQRQVKKGIIEAQPRVYV